MEEAPEICDQEKELQGGSSTGGSILSGSLKDYLIFAEVKIVETLLTSSPHQINPMSYRAWTCSVLNNGM